MAGFEGTSISSKVRKAKAADGSEAYTQITLKALPPGKAYSHEDHLYDALSVLNHVAAYPDLPVKIRTKGEGDFSGPITSLRDVSSKFAGVGKLKLLAAQTAEVPAMLSELALGEDHPLTQKFAEISQNADSALDLRTAAKKILEAYETANL
ncbi:MAG: hypothetical protein V1820_00160 [archaeon]